MIVTRVCDIVVVGGGVMGSAIAYHLVRRDPGLDVVVVERDPSYSQASSSLSVGNARVQFSLRQNIQISLHALEVFERFDEEMSVEGGRPDIRHPGNSKPSGPTESPPLWGCTILSRSALSTRGYHALPIISLRPGPVPGAYRVRK